MGIEGSSDTAKVTQLSSAEGGEWETAVEAQIARGQRKGEWKKCLVPGKMHPIPR